MSTSRPIRDTIAVGQNLRRLVDRRCFDQTDRAAAKAAAGHARTVDALDRLGQSGQHIDLGTGDLKVVAHRDMGSVHGAPTGDEIAGLKRALRLEHARVLGDDVATAAVDELGQLAAFGLELLRRHVAQRLDRPEIAAEQPHPFLASLAPQIVLAARMLVADPAVGDEQPQVWRDGDMARGETAAIDQERMPGDAAAGDILIHHPAAHADEIIFGPLTDLGDFDRIERQAAFGQERVRDTRLRARPRSSSPLRSGHRSR